jgi:hypothetical protein
LKSLKISKIGTLHIAQSEGNLIILTLKKWLNISNIKFY